METDHVIKEKCLKCNKRFLSDGPGYRICYKCSTLLSGRGAEANQKCRDQKKGKGAEA